LRVRCTGARSSFSGTSNHGVSTQAFGAYGASFVFVNDPGLVPPGPTPAPEPTAEQTPDMCYHSYCMVAQCGVTGRTKELTLTGAVGGGVYGSQIYTDDSNVLAAAVHAGALEPGETGTVRIICMGPQNDFSGTSLNGVTSQSWGAYPYSFMFDLVNAPTPPPPPPADVCINCLDQLCTADGLELAITVEGDNRHRIWGTDIYTMDSHVGAAATHAGRVQPGEVASVFARCTGPQSSFTGSYKNGIASVSYGAYGGSFTFIDALTVTEPVACQDGHCLWNKCTVRGATQTVTVTGTANGSVWGTDQYTDDSHVGVAAVHMQLVAIGQTANVVARCAGPAKSWTGTTRNGVTTQSYNSFWGYSFTLTAAT
jgi:hypothetical protein